ncbi:expressed unknown protein [Seminavis robusta]|uniref:Uncharacterized protein n=1 Tax=Seminavis robusta TaxID=568900 RepID=A0A9N8E7J1_9STRA|nr:expressed unknown protein [Seminavis robusta]|eukprot:Sro631_g178560.1 n/a (285) ;mRNA; r:44755-45609
MMPATTRRAHPCQATVLFLLFLFALCNRLHVSALPNAAGACPANEAAVGGSHLGSVARHHPTIEGSVTGTHGDVEITKGALIDGGLHVSINGRVLVAGNATNEFAIQQDNALVLEALLDAAVFRGFLLRLGGSSALNGTTTNTVDTTDALRVAEDDTDIQVSNNLCVATQGVGGLTHTDPEFKSKVTGILLMEELADNLPLDVTVVTQNRDGISEYYYSQYLLNAVEMVMEEEGTEGNEIEPDDNSEQEGESKEMESRSSRILPTKRRETSLYMILGYVFLFAW